MSGETEEDEDMLRALAASMEGVKDMDKKEADDVDESPQTLLTKNPAYPPLPEEPKGDKNLLCRVGVRLPDGRRLQRNFLRSDPIQVRFRSILLVVLKCCNFTIITPSGTLYIHVHVLIWFAECKKW